MRELLNFASPVVVDEERDYTWVIEFRETDDAGTPFNEAWEVYTAFPADNPRVKYPEKHKEIARILKTLRMEYFELERNVEYRIKLACRLTQELDISATETWMFQYEED